VGKVEEINEDMFAVKEKLEIPKCGVTALGEIIPILIDTGARNCTIDWVSYNRIGTKLRCSQ